MTMLNHKPIVYSVAILLLFDICFKDGSMVLWFNKVTGCNTNTNKAVGK